MAELGSPAGSGGHQQADLEGGADDVNLHAVGDRIAQLLDGLAASTEPRVFAQVEEMARLITELYGAALARIADLLADSPALLGQMASDELIGSLMVVHDLHPEGLAERVDEALESVRPALRRSGAAVSPPAIDSESGTVRVTVMATTTGCGSNPEVLRETVAEAVGNAAPDAASVEVAVVVDAPPTPVRLGVKPTAQARAAP